MAFIYMSVNEIFANFWHTNGFLRYTSLYTIGSKTAWLTRFDLTFEVKPIKNTSKK